MYQYIKTISPRGLEGKEITVEIDSNRSLPTIEIIGLPDNAIKESRERLRASYRACGIEIPPRKFVINLAPSDVRKSGTLFDLAIAVALLCCIADEARKHREECDQGLFF
jgi:magnesium chelatase family protein